MKKKPFATRSLSLAALLLVAACGGEEAPAAESAVVADVEPAAAPAAAAPGPVDVCALLPVEAVQRVLTEAGIAATVAGASPSTGMCSYSFAEPDARLLIDATRLGSDADAQASLASLREEYSSRGMAFEELPGVGDEALLTESPMEEKAGVKFREGSVIGQANLSVPGSTPKARRAAVSGLAGAVVAGAR